MDGKKPGEEGVLAWCNNLRFTMASDPGRQFFSQQIQKHGFDFLDSYLHDVFEGPKNEPVTELLKTPGRKKDAPRRTRAATAAAAKMKAVTFVSLDDEDVTFVPKNDDAKENIAPVNSFHQVLLQAQSTQTKDDVPNTPPVPVRYSKPKKNGAQSKPKIRKVVTIADSPAPPSPKKERVESPVDIVMKSPTPPPRAPAPQSDLVLVSETRELSVESELAHATESLSAIIEPPPVSEQLLNKDLSVIAEDDEFAERSRSSLLPSRSTPPVIAGPSQPYDTSRTSEAIVPALQNVPPAPLNSLEAAQDVSIDMDLDDTTSTSAHTFHSIQLNTPDASQPPIETSENMTAPLPQGTHMLERFKDEDHAMTEPLPSFNALHSATTDVTMPIRDAQSTTLTRKPSISQFVGLPAPSPFRKSMRLTREPSMGPSAAPAVTPAPVGGKRTSWLMKAREVKAMEGFNKRVSALGSGTGVGIGQVVGGTGVASGTHSTNKRKSVEMFGQPVPQPSGSATSHNGEERKAKVAKFNESHDEPPQSKAMNEDTNRTSQPNNMSHAQIPSHPLPSTSSQEIPPSRSHDFFAPISNDDFTAPLVPSDSQEGVLDVFKRTVQGLGTRTGKSMGRSLGGNAAQALAEAKAAAEARVAERNKAEGNTTLIKDQEPNPEPQPTTVVISPTEEHLEENTKSVAPVPTDVNSRESGRKLSMSDLVSSQDSKKRSEEQNKEIETIFHLPSLTSAASLPATAQSANTSTSTTPPNSPPRKQKASFILPTGPVFTMPPPVFVAPPPQASTSKPSEVVAGSSREFAFKLPPSNLFSMPSAMNLGVPASIPTSSSQFSFHKQAPPLSAQSSKASMFSDTIFDQENDVPAWMPTTQDTDYSIQPSQDKVDTQPDDLDDDDSWHVDEKFASNHMWTPFGFTSADKDDTMTWSTLPSQKDGDTGVQDTRNMLDSVFGEEGKVHIEKDSIQQAPAKQGSAPGAFDFSPVKERSPLREADLAMEVDDVDDLELESELDDVIAAGQSTVSLVGKDGLRVTRSHSQASTTSTSSSQSRLGIFGQASKFVTSVLAGKKGKPEVKSIQLAAAAAKKQQEEQEKKTARLKEMENRRQLALQRKADEEKARTAEEGRKLKEEAERRKREREDQTDKRSLRNPVTKKDEDNTKKRKVTVEIEKHELKKPPSKEAVTRIGKPNTAPSSAQKTNTLSKSAQKQPGGLTALTSHIATGMVVSSSSTNTKPSSMMKTVKPMASSSSLKSVANKGKGKLQYKDNNFSDQPPSQVLQAQMAERVKAQLKTADPPAVTSESIELPDINSEYSDSDDEDRPRTFDPPDWAQSPELHQALQQQSTVNPDDIFGRIGPLKMEDLFRTRQSRFRARTSSANWIGTDELTAEEEREYARRMGFR